MNRWVRVLVMWWLALALPVQAFANASLLHCATRLHGGAAMPDVVRVAASHGAATAALPVQHHGHQHGLHQGHGNGHGHDGASAAIDVEPSAVSGDDAGSPGHCGACSTCCVGVALPGAQSILHLADVSAHFQPLTPAPDLGVFAAGDERPPRQLLA